MNLSRIYWDLRAIFIKLRFRKLKFGNNCKFGTGTFFSKKAPIKIGDNFYCGPNCYISAHLSIGDRVLFGGHVLPLGPIVRVHALSPAEAVALGPGKARLFRARGRCGARRWALTGLVRLAPVHALAVDLVRRGQELGQDCRVGERHKAKALVRPRGAVLDQKALLDVSELRKV